MRLLPVIHHSFRWRNRIAGSSCRPPPALQTPGVGRRPHTPAPICAACSQLLRVITQTAGLMINRRLAMRISAALICFYVRRFFSSCYCMLPMPLCVSVSLYNRYIISMSKCSEEHVYVALAYNAKYAHAHARTLCSNRHSDISAPPQITSYALTL